MHVKTKGSCLQGQAAYVVSAGKWSGSFPTFSEKTNWKKDRMQRENMMGRRDKEDNAVWFCCGEKMGKERSGEDERQALKHSCHFSISALNVSPCQNLMMWIELISSLTNNKKAIPSLQRCKADQSSPSSLFILHIFSKGLFLGWEMEGERTAGGLGGWLQGKSIFCRQLQIDHLVQLKLITIIRLGSAMYHQMHSNNDYNNNGVPRYLGIQSLLNYEKFNWI